METAWLCLDGCETGQERLILVADDFLSECPWCGGEVTGPWERGLAMEILQEANELFGTEGEKS